MLLTMLFERSLYFLLSFYFNCKEATWLEDSHLKFRYRHDTFDGSKHKQFCSINKAQNNLLQNRRMEQHVAIKIAIYKYAILEEKHVHVTMLNEKSSIQMYTHTHTDNLHKNRQKFHQ
jgi:hypothetical protein